MTGLSISMGSPIMPWWAKFWCWSFLWGFCLILIKCWKILVIWTCLSRLLNMSLYDTDFRISWFSLVLLYGMLMHVLGCQLANHMLCFLFMLPLCLKCGLDWKNYLTIEMDLKGFNFKKKSKFVCKNIIQK